MARKSLRGLRAIGVLQEDIEAAKATQDAQRRNGSPVQTVEAIVGVTLPRRVTSTLSFDMTTEALDRRHSKYDKAALLLDQQALAEGSPERADKARELAKCAKALSSSPQLEFDFFGGGNVSIAAQYQDAITERLFELDITPSKRHEAMSVLWIMTRHMRWQSYEVQKTAAELADMLRIKPSNLSNTLKILENIGAIHRIKSGRQKIITINPEGVYRGNINNHQDAVQRFGMNVINGGKSE